MINPIRELAGGAPLNDELIGIELSLDNLEAKVPKDNLFTEQPTNALNSYSEELLFIEAMSRFNNAFSAKLLDFKRETGE